MAHVALLGGTSRPGSQPWLRWKASAELRNLQKSFPGWWGLGRCVLACTCSPVGCSLCAAPCPPAPWVQACFGGSPSSCGVTGASRLPMLVSGRGRLTASPRWDAGGSRADEYVQVALTIEPSLGRGGAAVSLGATVMSPHPTKRHSPGRRGLLGGCPSPPPPFISPSHGPAALAPSLSGW